MTAENAPLLYAVIFSKDRAAQLDSLLRSMHDHVAVPLAGTSVLYRASDASLKAGYERVASRNLVPGTAWREERSFRSDCISLLSSLPAGALVLTLVDDDVFFRTFSNAAVFDAFSPSRHCAISLVSYPEEEEHIPGIRRTPDYLEWKWAYLIKPRGFRLYPFCLDAYVYSRDLLVRLLPGLDFKAPNSLEGALNRAKRRLMVWRRGRLLATPEPCVFNNPLNRVQNESRTQNLAVSAGQLNERYCAGFEIDNADLYAASPGRCHFPVAVRFVRSV
jgi:hypothetical protein